MNATESVFNAEIQIHIYHPTGMKIFLLLVLFAIFSIPLRAGQDPDFMIDQPTMETATFGNGCFWCTEAVFQRLEGVMGVVSGYAGGHTDNPTYMEVVSGNTGHAEVVQVKFDPDVISYETLLEVFFRTHDPTTLNRQGNDIGTQYRSIILYHNEVQKETASSIIAELDKAGIWPDPIVTQVVPYTVFHEAEEYHQNYFNRNPEQAYCQVVILPKLHKFKKMFRDRLAQ